MTDMEEERMIEQAKAGDPKAQFEMSQWARQMSILEPNEERWNRLAAKCLVDAAQAGYEPAKRMVQDLISGTQSDSDAPAPEAPAAEPYAPASAETTERYVPETKRFSAGAAPVRPAPTRDFYDQADEEDYYDGSEPVDEVDAPEKEGFLATLKKIGEVLKKGGLLAAASIGGLIAGLRAKQKGGSAPRGRSAATAPTPESGRRSGSKRSRRSGFAAWVEDNWKVVRIVCIAICVVLAILIVILLIPPKNTEPEPTPTPLPTAEPTPEPTQEPFPNEATMLEISTTSTLLYRPGDSAASAYLPASQSFTVIEPEAENLRQGPSGSDYPNVITRIPEGTKVTAYARYENSEGTVWYLINSGGTWGWMYGPSLG